ncbi:putative inorganic phosphate cotransporter, partial [Teleopsis dalmanni]|uniref:putative inorganic phosphate cotransporter n=1 Tax=Teleopsis dalmanni TaxID=139649 RepID=UPI0018CF5DC6
IPSGSYFGMRHLQCLLLFNGLAVGYAMRVNLSVAIVAMTDENGEGIDFTVYNWTEQIKSFLLSSFFWGYFITQIPGGQLAVKFGGKMVFFYSILISSVLAVLTPLCTQFGDWKLLFALRAIQGLSQGALFPSTHTILSKWAPEQERGILCTFCYAGTHFGSVIIFAISGFIAASPLGWPGIFYVSGALGFLWLAVWFILGADRPSDCKSISKEEQRLIEDSIAEKQFETPVNQNLRTPWWKIFTSVPVLVLIVVHCAHNWGFWTLLTQIPTYMKFILNRDIKSNALLSTLPYLAVLLLCFVFCYVSNIFTKYRILKIGTNRKIFNTIGQWIPALTLIALGYVPSDQVNLAVAVLTITVGVNAASFLGFQVNHIDLSPNYAGILMGITNCAANIMSIIAPLVVGFVVSDETNPQQWRTIFYIAGGFYFIGNSLFIIFGKTRVQTWNESQSSSQEMKPVAQNINDVKVN